MSTSSVPSAPSSSASHRFSLRRSATSANGSRKVCPYGTRCFRRNPDHLRDEAHPADEDYLSCCRELHVEPEFVTVYQLFKWCDVDGSGRARRGEMVDIWDKLQALGQGIGPLDDSLWHTLDDDGNGFVNFSEFAEFTTKFKVTLPLGLDALQTFLGRCFDKNEALCCGVKDCQCRHFRVRRPRCKYGATCYQTNEEHKSSYCHPDDEDWEAGSKGRDANMCCCGHKQKLHASALCGAAAVEYPRYWVNVAETDDKEFSVLVPVGAEMLQRLQRLVDATYSNITTRDRMRHSGSWMVPEHFRVVEAWRNENSKLWRKHTIKKAELSMEKTLVMQKPEEAALLPPYTVFDDVITTQAWQAAGGDPLADHINEWYLWHGTSHSAAKNICEMDFKMRLAGSATGTLYGKGTYFAESITKSDEYARLENGRRTVLLCRVLGGRVRYCGEREPDADQLTRDCVEGPYDCVLGDRTKVSGTYREFVIFDTENVYPEYIITYEHGPLIKSPSHP